MGARAPAGDFLYTPPSMSLRSHAFPVGFIAPCLPTNASQPPSGEPWLHEIKHDGFRVIARKNGDRVKLYSRLGDDLTPRFPQIVDALERLRSRSCIIDGELRRPSMSQLAPSRPDLFPLASSDQNLAASRVRRSRPQSVADNTLPPHVCQSSVLRRSLG